MACILTWSCLLLISHWPSIYDYTLYVYNQIDTNIPTLPIGSIHIRKEEREEETIYYTQRERGNV